MKIRVKITSCCHSGLWYYNNIGEEYIVDDFLLLNHMFYSICIGGKDRAVFNSDCRVLGESIVRPVKRIKKHIL